MNDVLPRLTPRPLGPLDPDAEHRGRWGHYLVDRALCNAANTAHLLGRPLLLTGEPGCGKTDFAWVIAHAVDFRPTGEEPQPLQCHVRSEMSARDLLYHYDALLRFVDTHQPMTATDRARGDTPVDPHELSRYFELRGLGQALAWPRAERPVLLIDEIDKAPRDLPNDLLQALDVGEFHVAELRDDQEPISLRGGFALRRTMGKGQPTSKRPFVVITSNVEQQLPEPFLRRCVFFHIRFPRRDALVEIVQSRLSGGADGHALRLRAPLIKAAVDVFVALRNTRDLGKAPATSELIDWAETLARYWRPEQVGPWLKAFAGQVTGRDLGDDRLALSETEQIRWRNLPGLECLLKLRDDLERVRALV